LDFFRPSQKKCMSFEKDYACILDKAKAKVRFFHLNIEPEDLVNDAYVILHGQPYSLESFYKQIANLALIEKNNTRHDIPYGTKSFSTTDRFTGDNTCQDCKETKPVSQFHVYGSHGKKHLRNICKSCVSKRNKKSLLKRKGVEGAKKYNTAYRRKWVAKNRKKVKAYQRERYRIKLGKMVSMNA
jgi:hypothetical protein